MYNKDAFRPLIIAGTILGIGLGGLMDGILFNQVLQVHNIFSSSTFPYNLTNMEYNIFWDGIFQIFTWSMTLIGILVLWWAMSKEGVPRSGKCLTGSIFLGWGLFNLLEGIINHHILLIHHVVERADSMATLYWDLAYLGSGLFLIFVGKGLIRRAKQEAPYRQRGLKILTPRRRGQNHLKVG